MIGTIATGFCAGIAAGVTRDLVKVYLKKKRANDFNGKLEWIAMISAAAAVKGLPHSEKLYKDLLKEYRSLDNAK